MNTALFDPTYLAASAIGASAIAFVISAIPDRTRSRVLAFVLTFLVVCLGGGAVAKQVAQDEKKTAKQWATVEAHFRVAPDQERFPMVEAHRGRYGDRAYPIQVYVQGAPTACRLYFEWDDSTVLCPGAGVADPPQPTSTPK